MRNPLIAVLTISAASLLLGASLLAQAPAAPKKAATPPKNLKVLTAENYRAGMKAAEVGLGAKCVDCHEEDRSVDTKEMKVTARMMFAMVENINKAFADSKEHVTCYTCHRGAMMPVSAPAAKE